MDNKYNFTARFTNTIGLCSTMEIVAAAFEPCKKQAFHEAKTYHEDVTITIYDRSNNIVSSWNYIDGEGFSTNIF